MSDLDALMDMEIEELPVVEPVAQKHETNHDEPEQEQESYVEDTHEEIVPEPQARRQTVLAEERMHRSERYIKSDPGAHGGTGLDYYASGQDTANEASVDPDLNAELLDEHQARMIADRGPQTIQERAQLRMAKRAGII